MSTEKIKALTAGEALNEIGRASRLFKAFENASEVLTYMTGLEQRETELKARIASLVAEQESAEKALLNTREVDQRVAYDTIKQRDAMLAKAQAEALGVVERAKIEAQSMIDRANAAVAEARAGRDAALAEAKDAEERRDRAADAAADAERRLAAANVEIDRLLKRAG